MNFLATVESLGSGGKSSTERLLEAISQALCNGVGWVIFRRRKAEESSSWLITVIIGDASDESTNLFKVSENYGEKF